MNRSIEVTSPLDGSALGAVEAADKAEVNAAVERAARGSGGPTARGDDGSILSPCTLSSKSISSNSTQNAVELKVLIEQMREQIQNLE